MEHSTLYWKKHPYDTLALIFATVFPTIITIIYFDVLTLAPASVQQGVYSIGKIIQFGFPVIFAWATGGLVAKKCKKEGLALGLGSGLVLLVVAAVIYYMFLKNLSLFGELQQQVLQKVGGLNIQTPFSYLVLSIFYCLAHSFLEEYYWRWFVFRGLLSKTTLLNAAVVSGIGFMAHHVIVLKVFFGWDSPLVYVFSACIAIGGMLWAWMYAKHKSLLGPWVSHIFIDIAIFAAGADMIFG